MLLDLLPLLVESDHPTPPTPTRPGSGPPIRRRIPTIPKPHRERRRDDDETALAVLGVI